MIKVNAVDSFCHLKKGKGNGEKKLYISSTNHSDFMENYLGIDIEKGSNIYAYNDEFRSRTKGMKGFVTKKNLEKFFDKTKEFYDSNDYENAESLRYKNQEFLNNMDDKVYFEIDCSKSKNRLYVGSKDQNWKDTIPAFSIPQKTKVTIINMNDSDELEFKISLKK